MSLGWNTESALLPSASKAIKVTSSSMRGLKAEIEGRQKTRSEEPEAVVWHRGRKRGGEEGGGMKKRNRGVAERARLDKVDDRAVLSETKLRAKALVYEELAAKGESVSEDVVVDFRAKRTERPTESAQRTEPGPTEAAQSEPWAWSTGRRDSDSADVAALVDQAARRVKPTNEPDVPQSGGVRSQWEKTPSAAQKGFYAQVADETARGRRDAEIRATQRQDKRRELEARLLARRRPSPNT